LLLAEPVHACLGSSNHHLLAILANFLHFSVLLIDKVSFILGILAEVDAQVSQAIFTLIEVVADLLSTNTVIDGTHQNVMAASHLVFQASS
jgi:hypothetical protein